MGSSRRLITIGGGEELGLLSEDSEEEVDERELEDKRVPCEDGDKGHSGDECGSPLGSARWQ